VHVARDDELVVIHDPTLDRTTDGQGPVARRTSVELANTKLCNGGQQGVSRLDEVFDVFAGTSIELHIEIKTDAEGRLYPGLERRLVDLIVARNLEQQAILTSFVPSTFERIRKISRSQRVMASVNQRSADALGGLEAALDRYNAIGNCLVAVGKAMLAAEIDFCLKKVGAARLGAWVPNNPEDIANWLEQPIRHITTDRPDVALALRRT
jgi:glycerophosphoryl diester phosphodiesterase